MRSRESNSVVQKNRRTRTVKRLVSSGSENAMAKWNKRAATADR